MKIDFVSDVSCPWCVVGLKSLEMEGKQRALKNALFTAYFTEGRDPSNHDVLVSVAGSVGLDEARARQILESGEFAEAVRERERFYTGLGVHAVPSVIINDRHLIQGGQPPEVFEKALRQLAAGDR